VKVQRDIESLSVVDNNRNARTKPAAALERPESTESWIRGIRGISERDMHVLVRTRPCFTGQHIQLYGVVFLGRLRRL
jgi:hypothetical protein